MLVGLAPLFIMCLIFEQTKDLFRRWLMYLLGTLFSMAMLNLVVSWTLDLTLRVAGALWTTDALAQMTGLTATGFDTQAFQQGGVGLLMTAVIVSTPPMAAMLFNGTLGSFSAYSTVNGGGGNSRPGPQGQPPGYYGGGGGYAGGYAPPAGSQNHPNSGYSQQGGFSNPATAPQRSFVQTTESANKDAVRPYDKGT